MCRRWGTPAEPAGEAVPKEGRPSHSHSWHVCGRLLHAGMSLPSLQVQRSSDENAECKEPAGSREAREGQLGGEKVSGRGGICSLHACVPERGPHRSPVCLKTL